MKNRGSVERREKHKTRKLKKAVSECKKEDIINQQYLTL